MVWVRFCQGDDRQFEDRLGVKADKVCFQPVYWAPVLAGREKEVWDGLSTECDLDWVRLRKFVLNALGDATAYRNIPEQSDCTTFKGSPQSFLLPNSKINIISTNHFLNLTVDGRGGDNAVCTFEPSSSKARKW